MGPPKTRAAAAPNRSRFQEGSMNDRTSAAPPVQFVNSKELAELEKPVPLEICCRKSGDLGDKRQPNDSASHSKKGSKLLGQVWEGFRGRLRLRKDVDDDKDKLAKKPEPPAPRVFKDVTRGELPSRDDIMANYNELVASGFFASHAIHSSRQPGPASRAPSRPATSHGGQQSPPQWPLTARPLTPAATRPSSPIRSPTSASSRGTKRAAEEDIADGEVDSELSMPRKLRRMASREVAMPKLRKVASRHAILGRRSISASFGGSSATDREPNKLTKRGGITRSSAALRSHPQNAVNTERLASAKRNVSDGTHAFALNAVSANNTGGVSTTTRALRPRVGAEPLKVVPNANRGIPSVPVIPAKFTYGTDRENAGPWRGLRR